MASAYKDLNETARIIAGDGSDGVATITTTTQAATNAEACEELRDVCVCLNDAANALEELAELVMPNLPTGPRELFEIAETGLYERMRTCMNRVSRAAASIEEA